MELQKDCHQLIPGQSVVDKCQITIRKFIWCRNDVNYVSCAFFSFNQLDLPEYTSKEQLQDRLLLAIHEASEGFGFG